MPQIPSNDLLAKAEANRVFFAAEQSRLGRECSVELLMQKVIASHDVVFGIFPDEGEDNGFGAFIIKGAKIFRNKDVTVAPDRVDAIPFEGREMAEYLGEQYGGGDSEND